MPSTASNPLLELHCNAQAEFQNWAQLEIVQTFGQPQAEYSAIRKSAGLMDLPHRGLLELTGKDRWSFLNNLLTNQTWNKATRTGLELHQRVYSFMLNLKGRIVLDMNILELGRCTLIEMDSRFVEPLKLVLEKYLFTEQVSLASRIGQFHQIGLHGPRAHEVLGLSLDQKAASADLRLFNIDMTVWRDDSTGAPGYTLIMPTESARHVWASLIAAHGESQEMGKRLLRPVGWAAFNATRIENGRAIFGIDFDGAPIASALPGKKTESVEDSGASGALPAETGLLHRAVSFTKGCYLGQEIVARMDARKQIARQVVGFKMEGDALPIAGSEILDENQTSTIGVVTSSTISPLLSNSAIGLAMIKRPHFATGTKLRIPAEGSVRAATVAQTPFIHEAMHP